MMALGSFRFGMTNGAYQKFSRSAGYRWNEVDRIGREPALQYLGPGAQEIAIEGVIYRKRCPNPTFLKSA
ncbi:putative phage tail protein U [Rhodobacteraceae bacterium KLH11]|nr:putative phage tail protein U [Rhodobacteraceae bacterium KLH11]